MTTPKSDPLKNRADIKIEIDIPITEQPDCDAIRATLFELVSDHSAEGTVSVILADDGKLRRLNQDFRGIDEVTDVLSFDLKDDLSGGEIGEVYISLDRAGVQAQFTSRDLMDEVAHLAIHGFLHLLGYDHNTDVEHLRMRRQEARYLARFKQKGA